MMNQSTFPSSACSGHFDLHCLQDQQAALRWVAANVRAFGGNPDQVMIFGESAGAFSVCWHLVSPQSTGLFRAALMESGTCDAPQFFQNAEIAAAYRFAFFSVFGGQLKK